MTAAGGRGGDAAPKCLPCNADSDCDSDQRCQAVTDPRSGVARKQCGPCDCTSCTSDAQCNAALGQTCKTIGGNIGQVCADASNRCGPPIDDEIECRGTQNNGTCDSCGGGGGGGSVVVQARTSNVDPRAQLDASGGLGGLCPICTGEAGVTAATTSGVYAGEVCDGFDNDFNGIVDDAPAWTCADGSTLPRCANGALQLCACPADTGSACDNGKLGACRVTGTRACSDDHLTTACTVVGEAGAAPSAEVCNGIDDDCDGVVDITAAGASVCAGDAGADAGDAGAADAGSEDDIIGVNVDGCSCRAGGRDAGVGALGLAGLALVSLVGRRRRRA